MPTYRDEGVVLRTHKLGEADRIITVLSRRHGKVRAVARGVRRTSSKWGARLEPFSHVDLQFATGRTLDVITEAVTLHAWSEPVCTDYPRYTVGQVVEETRFTSTSTNGAFGEGRNVKMVFRAHKSARDVAHFSLHKNEQEVLFAPGLRLRVKAIRREGYTTIVEVEEA